MPSVIAVSGPPGAGKSTLVAGLARALSGAGAIHMDGYDNMTRLPIETVARWYREGADIDAFDFPQLQADLQRLKHGPGKYLLFETQFGRAHRATGRHVDLLIWIDTPLDIALARNVQALAGGFLAERSPEQLAGRLRWLQDYVGNYLGTVRELVGMQAQRVAPAADIVIDGQASPEQMVRAAQEQILRRLP
jgi:uridine kinase